MPTVKKTSIKKKTVKKKTGRAKGVLGRLMPVVDMKEGGVKVNVYGRGKTGKTRWACTFPKKLCLIGTEDGTRSVRTVKGVEFVQLQHPNELMELIPYVRENCKTAVLDHAGGLQDLVLKEVLGLDDIPLEKTWGTADRDDWGRIGQQTKYWLNELLELSRENINIVVIAHERNFKEDDSDMGRIMPNVGSALTPSVCNWLNGECDYICQTYIREGTITKTRKVGKKTVKTKVQTGEKEYCLRVGPHEIFMTGFRLPPGLEQLPECIVNPDYNKFAKLAKGEI